MAKKPKNGVFAQHTQIHVFLQKRGQATPASPSLLKEALDGRGARGGKSMRRTECTPCLWGNADNDDDHNNNENNTKNMNGAEQELRIIKIFLTSIFLAGWKWTAPPKVQLDGSEIRPIQADSNQCGFPSPPPVSCP